MTTKKDAGAEQVQDKVDKETQQGFSGVEIDPTPNENYSVAGVTKGAPTPETDAKAAAEARDVTGLGKTGIEINTKPAAKGEKK